MDTYFASQPVTITFVLTDSAGSSITDASEVRYRVLDGEGIEIAPFMALPEATNQPSIDVTVDAGLNVVGTDKVRAFRRVELAFVSGGKDFLNFEEYIVELQDTLRVALNSFQSYADAMMLMSEISGIAALNEATRSDRIRGLISAYHVVSRLRFSLSSEVCFNPLVAAPGWSTYRDLDLRSLTQEQFEALPDQFLSALKIAQVIEANEALDEFSILKKRQQGLMSESIGESSVMFRPEKVLNTPLTRRGLEYLRPYLVWELGVGRG